MKWIGENRRDCKVIVELSNNEYTLLGSLLPGNFYEFKDLLPALQAFAEIRANMRMVEFTVAELSKFIGQVKSDHVVGAEDAKDQIPTISLQDGMI